MKSSCSTWIFVVLAAFFGLVLGLLVGWVLWPVEWINASPENLRLEFQTDYLEMAMDSYQVNQNVELAQQRYQWLGENGPEALAAVVENPTWVTQPEIDAYVTAISSPTTSAAPVPTPAPVSTLERLKPLVGWILLVILLALAAIVLLAIVLLRVLHGRKEEAEVKPVESTAELEAPVTVEEAPVAVAGAAAVAAEELAEPEPAPVEEGGEAAPETEEAGGVGAAGLAAAALVGAAVAGGERGEQEEEAYVEEEMQAEAGEQTGQAAAEETEAIVAGEAEAGGIGVEGLAAAALVGGVAESVADQEQIEVEPVLEETETPAVEEIGWALEEETPEKLAEEAPEATTVDEWVAEKSGAETKPLEAPETYGRYNLKVIDIEGIGPAYAARLEQLGITTTHALLQQCATPRGRQQLAEMSEISPTLILEWANHADLMRIRGIGPQWSDLLEMAGVNTVREMAMRKPAHLHAKLVEINAEKNLVRQLPTEAQVEDWVEQAKELPAILTY